MVVPKTEAVIQQVIRLRIVNSRQLFIQFLGLLKLVERGQHLSQSSVYILIFWIQILQFIQMLLGLIMAIHINQAIGQRQRIVLAVWLQQKQSFVVFNRLIIVSRREKGTRKTSHGFLVVGFHLQCLAEKLDSNSCHRAKTMGKTSQHQMILIALFLFWHGIQYRQGINKVVSLNQKRSHFLEMV